MVDREKESRWSRETEQILKDFGDRFYDLHYYNCVDSTNNVIKREAAAGAPEGLVIVAEEQTAGKGRRGRNWSSPAGESIYMSILLMPALAPERLSELTLVMGLSVAQAVSGLYGLDAAIKWPNDIVIDGRKICGILTELFTVPNSSGAEARRIVIGTGINVNNEVFPEELAERAVSLRMLLGKPVSRGPVLAGTLLAFRENYRICLATGDLTGLRKPYNSRLISFNKPVRIEDPRQPYTGISRGIDETGRLIVEKSGGGIEAVSSGEVSVRGLYGYV